ncbi:hypothetical protein D3C80_2154850 [compost metagenome]
MTVKVPSSCFFTMTRSVNGRLRLMSTLLWSMTSASNLMPSADLSRLTSNSDWFTRSQPSSGSITLSGWPAKSVRMICRS